MIFVKIRNFFTKKLFFLIKKFKGVYTTLALKGVEKLAKIKKLDD